MSEPFLAEIRIVGFDYAPRGWAFCDGQILPIVQNQALFSLLGTTYGGDGRISFALPDLRGRTPVHVGPSHLLGQKGGAESVTLSVAEVPNHGHTARGSSATADAPIPQNNVLADSAGGPYRDHEAATSVELRGGSIANAGGSQAHNNMQPYLALRFCIALQGLFPSRN